MPLPASADVLRGGSSSGTHTVRYCCPSFFCYLYFPFSFISPLFCSPFVHSSRSASSQSLLAPWLRCVVEVVLVIYRCVQFHPSEVIVTTFSYFRVSRGRTGKFSLLYTQETKWQRLTTCTKNSRKEIHVKGCLYFSWAF